MTIVVTDLDSIADYVYFVLSCNGIYQIHGCNTAWETIDDKNYIFKMYVKEFDSLLLARTAVDDLINQLLNERDRTIMWRMTPRIKHDDGKYKLWTRYVFVPYDGSKLTKLTNMWMS